MVTSIGWLLCDLFCQCDNDIQEWFIVKRAGEKKNHCYWSSFLLTCFRCCCLNGLRLGGMNQWICLIENVKWGRLNPAIVSFVFYNHIQLRQLEIKLKQHADFIQFLGSSPDNSVGIEKWYYLVPKVVPMKTGQNLNNFATVLWDIPRSDQGDKSNQGKANEHDLIVTNVRVRVQ